MSLYSTTYPVTAEPFSERGAFHARSMKPSPLTATTSVGDSGIPAGTTTADDSEKAPCPMPFRAATWKIYDVPFTSPVTVIDEPAAGSRTCTQDSPVSLYSTTYPVTAEPLSSSGAFHVRLAIPSPADATTSVGTPANPAGVTALESEDQSPDC